MISFRTVIYRVACSTMYMDSSCFQKLLWSHSLQLFWKLLGSLRERSELVFHFMIRRVLWTVLRASSLVKRIRLEAHIPNYELDPKKLLGHDSDVSAFGASLLSNWENYHQKKDQLSPFKIRIWELSRSRGKLSDETVVVDEASNVMEDSLAAMEAPLGTRTHQENRGIETERVLDFMQHCV